MRTDYKSKFERAYLTGQVCISCQQERKELFEKILVAVIGANANNSIKISGLITEVTKLAEAGLEASQKFAKEAKTHE